VGVHGPKAVSPDRQIPRVGVLVVAEENAQLGRQPLQKQKQKKLVGLMAPGTQFEHAGQELRRFLVSQIPHVVKLLDLLEVGELVGGQQPGLQLRVGGGG
jgi:hypothetical protein